MTRIVLSLAAFALLAAAQPQAQSKPAAPARVETRTAAATTIVNLNTASAAELEKLPGVGATTAARIVEYRQKKGPFKKIEDLHEAGATFVTLRRFDAHRRPDGCWG